MKLVIPFIFILMNFGSYAQDTTIVQTFTLDSTGRAAVFTFPDNPTVNYEKIIMQYRMRCHDALVGNGNVGCREWDYHCNTVITDSSNTDSVWSTHPNYIITGSNSNPFYYINSPTFDYLLYTQQEVIYNSIITEELYSVGSGNSSLQHPFATENRRSKTHFLYTAEELTAAGLEAGDITGIQLDIDETGSQIDFLKIRIKHTALNELEPFSPELSGFTEVYFLNTNLTATGLNSFNFYEPFNWNGEDNIIVEVSFTLPESGESNIIIGESATGTVKLINTLADDSYLAVNQGDYIEVPNQAFSNIDSAITVSFWQYGDPDLQPFNSYLFEGADENNNRVINCHLPWSNSRIYWDAGNSGTSSYDRIDKEATFDEYAGKWNHWAMTKNSGTGEMKLYLNGELWHNGTNKFRSMEGIVKFKIAGNKNSGQYAGFLNEFRIWNIELSESAIKDWMYMDVDNSHPNYDNLVLYYKFNDDNGTSVPDHGPGGHDGTIGGQPLYVELKGHQLNRNFTSHNSIPNIVFVRGEYNQTINEISYLDSLQRPYNTVYSYYVENNDLIPNDTAVVWEAGYMPVYNESGDLVDSVYVEPEDQLNIETLEYYRKWPSRYELLSFITPYGNGLDLGEEGVMWEFDVTDFKPVLTGEKFLSIEGVGKNSEELDIRFLFIEGTPARDVLTINPIWPIANANQVWYGFGPSAIENDEVFEPREILMNPDASFFKVRSAITGHGQNGEFTPKWHYINIDGDDWEFEYKVWNECATIPIYPQGGTWLFDRAGWCPGDPTTLFEFDITDYVSPGQSHTLDYGLTNIAGLPQADYRIANQLVTYGPANFNLDAAINGIKNPNREIAAFKRFNPACTNPEIIIQNTGSTQLSSLEITYWVEGGETANYAWTGNLDFLQEEFIELPIPGYSFWYGSSNIFHVQISEPNGLTDEYANNNTYQIEFETTDVYDIDESLEVHCYTNNYASQTSYYLADAQGNVIFEHDNLENTTLYTDVLSLEPGCYKLRIDDSADDGLYYWYNTGQGSGYLRIKNSVGYILENIEPEFGRFAEYEFAIVDITGKREIEKTKHFSIYPNPAKSEINFKLSGYSGQKVKINILDPSQKIVLQFDHLIDKASFSNTIEIQNLDKGIYFLQLITNERSFIQKFIKL